MAHVMVVGAGNIGSHVVGHVGRMRGVTAVTVVDPQRYDQSNVDAQHIFAPDVGKSKARIQAKRLRQINRSLDTRAFEKAVEDLPLGWLRADVILACLDSRRSRMAVNQAAWRLGVPSINAGVDADGLLARVQVFVPAAEAPCLECAWDARDYQLVEQTYACQAGPGSGVAPRTGASSGLGGLAAALQALECEKLLAGDRDHLLVGRDVLVDARHHRQTVTTFARNHDCPMPDHAGWRITPYTVEASSSLGELLAMATTLRGAETGVRVSVAGRQLAMTLTCPSCAARQRAGYVHRATPGRGKARCPRCRVDLVANGFDLCDDLPSDALPDGSSDRTLRAFGLVSGDIVTLATSDAQVHLELSGAAWPIAS